jgi:hypothetical protein
MKLMRNIIIREGEVLVDGRTALRHEDPLIGPFSRVIYKHYGMDYSKFYKMSPLSKLGFLAAELLLSGEELSGIDPSRISVFLANRSSSLHTDAIYQDSVASKPSPAIFVYTLPNIVIGEICIRHGITGEGIFLVQEAFGKEAVRACAAEQLDRNAGLMALSGWVEVDMQGAYLADLDLWTP